MTTFITHQVRRLGSNWPQALAIITAVGHGGHRQLRLGQFPGADQHRRAVRLHRQRRPQQLPLLLRGHGLRRELWSSGPTSLESPKSGTQSVIPAGPGVKLSTSGTLTPAGDLWPERPTRLPGGGPGHRPGQPAPSPVRCRVERLDLGLVAFVSPACSANRATSRYGWTASRWADVLGRQRRRCTTSRRSAAAGRRSFQIPIIQDPTEVTVRAKRFPASSSTHDPGRHVRRRHQLLPQRQLGR